MSAEDNELLQRVRRIETRLYRLCQQMSVEDPPGHQMLTGRREEDGIPYIMVQGYDVSIGQITRQLARDNIDITITPVEVIIAGKDRMWLDQIP